MRPLDYIYFFITQFLHHSSYAYTFGSHTCTHRINARVLSINSHLCSLPRFSSHSFYLHFPLSHLRHFSNKQLLYKIRMGSRKNKLHTSCLSSYAQKVYLYSITHNKLIRWRLFSSWQYTHCILKIHNYITININTPNCTCYDLALFLFILFKS